MIQPIKETRQIRRRLEREQVKSEGVPTQKILNSLLWKHIIEKGGTLDIPVEDLKGVPLTFALMVQIRTGRIIVTAGVFIG